MPMADHVPNLGHTPDCGAMRDCIHLAVCPAVCGGSALSPGQRVKLVNDLAVPAEGDEIGIVDPFLVNQVADGQTFWLCLLPGTITGLRHSWSHPAFKPKPTK